MTSSSGPTPIGGPKSPSPSSPFGLRLKPELELTGLSPITLREIVQGLLDARTRVRTVESLMDSILPLTEAGSPAAKEVERIQMFAKDLSNRVYDLYVANAKKALGEEP